MSLAIPGRYYRLGNRKEGDIWSGLAKSSRPYGDQGVMTHIGRFFIGGSGGQIFYDAIQKSGIIDSSLIRKKS